MFFEEAGDHTDEVAEAIARRAMDGDVDVVVVASISGLSAIKVAERLAKIKVRVVCVSGPKSWRVYPEYHFPLIKRKERGRLKKLQVRIVSGVDEPFRPLVFRNWWAKKTLKLGAEEAGLFWMTLICVGGHGLRTAVESVFMAVEAGAAKEGEMVIAAAGTGTGLDSAVTLAAGKFEDIVGEDPNKRLKIREILAMPQATQWIGYG